MSTFYGWLSTEPPILLHSDNPELFGYLPPWPLTRIQIYAWHHSAERIAEFDAADRRQRPRDTLHHCVNDAETCRYLRARGISAAHVTPNAFLDENVFTVASSGDRPFDAVYNGRMNPFKRHYLAARIQRLMIIGGVYASDDSWEYFEQLRRELPQAWFPHADEHRFRSPAEIADLLGLARVGLCLSACEGAMYAATEYLLCGLPVVSTSSLGGRDTWFAPEVTRIVPDDPRAVADAVDELCRLGIPPEQVRESALRQLSEQRGRFHDLGRRIYDDLGVTRDFVADLETSFVNKLGDWLPTEDVMRWHAWRLKNPRILP